MASNDWGLSRYLTGDLTDMFYIEWKYFCFQAGDTLGIVSYSVGDPMDRLGLGKGIVYASVYHAGRIVSETMEVPLSGCRYSGTGPGAELGPHGIETGDHGIRIKGSGRRLQWDLTYSAVPNMTRNRYRINSTIYPRSWMDWNIAMPASPVRGTVRVEDVNVSVDGTGYSDGNRGKWVPFMPLWNTVIYQDPETGVTLAMAKFHNNIRRGDMYLFTENGSTHFPGRNFKLRQWDWEKDSRTGLRFPRRAVLTARAGDISIQASLTHLAVDALTIRVPGPFPSLAINEQVCSFNVSVLKGGRVIHRNPAGLGYNESASRRWLLPHRR